jgi:hypothetical protein
LKRPPEREEPERRVPICSAALVEDGKIVADSPVNLRYT